MKKFNKNNKFNNNWCFNNKTLKVGLFLLTNDKQEG